MRFLKDYLVYSSGNEAPTMFHVWAGLVCVSAAVSRKVWLPNGKFLLYPNIYVMYVGGAGNGKSFAMRHCTRLLKRIEKIPISKSVETPEGMLRFMGGDPPVGDKPGRDYEFKFMCKGPTGNMTEVNPMTIIANEYIDFISKNPEGWTNLLNNIFDEDKYDYGTKNQGQDVIINPYMVMLGALTTEVSSDLHKQKIISTGLARRTIFQYGERQFDTPHAEPTYTPEQIAAEERCLAHLRALRLVNGAMFRTDRTKLWYKEWYDAHNVNVPKKAPQVQGWFASKPDQVLKLGMLLALCEDPPSLEVRIDHMEAALDYLAILERDLFKVFGGVGRNEVAQIAVKIKNFLEQQKSVVPYTKMWSLFFSDCKSKEELDMAIQFLVEDGQIVEAYADLGSSQVKVFAIDQSLLERLRDRVKESQPLGEARPSWH
jgi:hypothetical protein